MNAYGGAWLSEAIQKVSILLTFQTGGYYPAPPLPPDTHPHTPPSSVLVAENFSSTFDTFSKLGCNDFCCVFLTWGEIAGEGQWLLALVIGGRLYINCGT